MKTFYRHALFFLVLLLLLGLTKQASSCPYLGSTYVDSDGTWTVDNYCDSTQAAAVARRDSMANTFFKNDGPYTSHVGSIDAAAPVGTIFYISYVNPVNSYHLAVFWVGSSTATCSSQRTAASQQCGGDDKYDINEQTCVWSCKIASNCAQQYEALQTRCGGIDKIYGWNNSTCSGHCQGCADVSADAAISCPYGYVLNPSNCSYACKTCENFTSACNVTCAATGVLNSSCAQDAQGNIAQEPQCNCRELEKPKPPAGPDGPDIDDLLPKNCDYYRSQCNPSCNFLCSNDVSGYAGPHSCDCSTQPDPIPNDPSKPQPPPDPTNPDDTNGWLSGVKGNLDTIAKQNNDITGWLEGIKHNSDVNSDLQAQNNQYNANIAENLRRNVDNQGVFNRNLETASDNIVSAINNLGKTINGSSGKTSSGGTPSSTGSTLNQSVNNLDSSIHNTTSSVNSVNTSISTLSSGLSHVGISTDSSGLAAAGDLGDVGYVTGVGYGSAPVDADLPADTSFGTFVPRVDGGFRSQISTSLSHLSIETSSAVCGLTLKIPRLTASWSWEWLDFPVDFCPYESMLSAIGTLLVFAAALNELYKFS